MEEPLKLFLSHASKNAETMIGFADELESLGYACWYAPRNIPYGDNYLTEILDALDKVDVVILLHSREVHESSYVFREIQYADNQNKLIIPIMIDDADVARNLKLIISTMQMLTLANFPSISAAVEELHQRMEEYKSARQYGGFSSGWLHRVEKKINLSNTVQLGSLIGFKISQPVLDNMKEVYEQAPGFQEASVNIEEQRFTILQNEQRVGKYSSGLALLTQMKLGTIIELLPTLSLSDLVQTPLKPSTGYIIDGVDLSFFEYGTAAVWQELQARLQQIDSYLVLTTDEWELNLPVPVIKPQAPDPEAVLKKHAAHLKIESLLEDFMPKLEPYIPGQLPFEMAEMAKLLLSVEQGIWSFEEAEQRFQSKIEERIICWFQDNGPSLDHTVHYLALALVKETTDRAYQSMVASIKGALKPVWDSTSSTFMTDNKRMELLTAERIKVKVNTDLRITTEDGIRLKHPEEADEILSIFWDMFRQARPYLLQWFDDRFRTAKQNERSSLEDAVALLASKDFLLVRQQLLQKWAKDDNADLRVSTARILSKMVMTNLRTQEVSYLVNSWGSQKHNKNLLSTAVSALGSETGFFMYPKSLDLLKMIFLSNPKAMGYAAKQSFIHLSKLGDVDPEYDERLLQFFKDWLAEELEKTNGNLPKAFLFFFFSIISHRDLSGLPKERLAAYLEPFAVYALMSGETKSLVFDYLREPLQQSPGRVSPLVSKLLYHPREAVRERTLYWIKTGLNSVNQADYKNLYHEIKKLQGGIRV